jgi:hypothetical protein
VHDPNPLLLVNAGTSPHRVQDNSFLETVHLHGIARTQLQLLRIGLGSTIGPALSIVTAVITMVFCHGIWHWLRIWTSFGREGGAPTSIGMSEDVLPSCNSMHVLFHRGLAIIP